jgi:hypothetical protein
MTEALALLGFLAKLIPPLATILHDLLDGDEDTAQRVRDVLPARHGLHAFVEKNTPRAPGPPPPGGDEPNPYDTE